MSLSHRQALGGQYTDHTELVAMADAREAEMSSPTDRELRPWRRFLRFSVRGLIIFVVVLGAGLGWIVRQAHIQRDAVAAIRKAGGRVSYNWEWDPGKSIQAGRPWAPSWLVDLIGVDFFGHVTSVDLTGSSMTTDAMLAEVGRLNQLQQLSVHTSVTDAGLVHLKGLTNLSSLGVAGTQVTDAGLMHLKGLTNLSLLFLGGTRVTDAGMNELKRTLPGLTIHHPGDALSKPATVPLSSRGVGTSNVSIPTLPVGPGEAG
jgi:hypothetical protein